MKALVSTLAPTTRPGDLVYNFSFPPRLCLDTGWLAGGCQPEGRVNTLGSSAAWFVEKLKNIFPRSLLPRSCYSNTDRCVRLGNAAGFLMNSSVRTGSENGFASFHWLHHLNPFIPGRRKVGSGGCPPFSCQHPKTLRASLWTDRAASVTPLRRLNHSSKMLT